MHAVVKPLEDCLNLVAAVTVFLAMLLATANIIGRLAGFPIPGYLDIFEQSIALFAFLGIAYAQRLGVHIRMDMVIRALKGRLHWMLEAITTFLSAGVVLVLAIYAWQFFLRAWTLGDTTPNAGIPTWPAKLLIPLAFGVWIMRLAIEFTEFVRLAIWPDAEPVTAQFLHSVADQARDEIHEIVGDEADLATAETGGRGQ